MYILYFENKNNLRYYIKDAVYDSNGKIRYLLYSGQSRGNCYENWFIIDDESEVDKISTYIINGLINRTHFIGLENDGYTFIVKKL